MSFRLFQLSQKFPGENLRRHVFHLQDYAMTADALPQTSKSRQFQVVPQFEISALRFWYGPRFAGTSRVREALSLS
jgi:hypothetical protein